MPRAMWKGAIQFGLVTIPVKLYTATESGKTISFNMLHEKDLTRIQMKIYCPVEDEEVISAHRHGQGLRVRAGPVRRHHGRGPREGAAQDGPFDRDRAVHRSDEDSDDPLREAGLLPRAGPDRAQGVLAPEVGPRREGPHGDLQGRDQGPRGPGRAGSVRAHDAADHHQVAGRDPRRERARPARGGAGVQAGRAARWRSSSSRR